MRVFTSSFCSSSGGAGSDRGCSWRQYYCRVSYYVGSNYVLLEYRNAWAWLAASLAVEAQDAEECEHTSEVTCKIVKGGNLTIRCSRNTSTIVILNLELLQLQGGWYVGSPFAPDPLNFTPVTRRAEGRCFH